MADEPKPSYVRKADRAEKHILDLESMLDDFASKDPYTVTGPVKRKHGERFSRLVFTEQPDPEVELIAGDIMYNLRASFDYLIGSLVPSSQRSSVLCPMLREPVWEIPHVSSENKQRTKDRDRWNSLVHRIRSTEAIAVLKDLMPLDSRRQPPQVHILDAINRLSNKDRHQRLPIITSGLRDVRFRAVLKGGAVVNATAHDFDYVSEGLKDHAAFLVPDGAVHMKVQGIPIVVIRIGEEWENFRIPDIFRQILTWLRTEAFARLGPYSKRGG